MLKLNGSLDLEHFTLKVKLEINKNETVSLLAVSYTHLTLPTKRIV